MRRKSGELLYVWLYHWTVVSVSTTQQTASQLEIPSVEAINIRFIYRTNSLTTADLRKRAGKVRKMNRGDAGMQICAYTTYITLTPKRASSWSKMLQRNGNQIYVYIHITILIIYVVPDHPNRAFWSQAAGLLVSCGTSSFQFHPFLSPLYSGETTVTAFPESTSLFFSPLSPSQTNYVTTCIEMTS